LAKRSINKKIRTREHVIADFSANHIEYYSLKNNFSVEHFEKDYGYDVNIYTYNDAGEFENGTIFIQLKATDSPKFVHKNKFISFPIDKKDLNLWLFEPYPCIFVLYDAKKEKSYWIYIQAYFEKLANFNIDSVNKSYSVNIPISNTIDENVIKNFQTYKNNILDQIEGKIKHLE
jgi:hypothetical protein